MVSLWFCLYIGGAVAVPRLVASSSSFCSRRCFGCWWCSRVAGFVVGVLFGPVGTDRLIHVSTSVLIRD